MSVTRLIRKAYGADDGDVSEANDDDKLVDEEGDDSTLIEEAVTTLVELEDDKGSQAEEETDGGTVDEEEPRVLGKGSDDGDDLMPILRPKNVSKSFVIQCAPVFPREDVA